MFFKKRKDPRADETPKEQDTAADRQPTPAEKKKVEQVRNDAVIYDRFEATDN